MNCMKFNIPKKEQECFDRFYAMISKCHVLGNIKEEDMDQMKKKFNDCLEKIEKKYKKNDYDKARKIMADYIMKLQLRRPIEGFTHK